MTKLNKNEILVGIEVELEHTTDRNEALRIAIDHVKERNDYYSKLVASGIVDEPKAIKMAKSLLNVEPKGIKENIKNIIREEITELLKEEPDLWKYIYNFSNTYIPKKQNGR